MDCKSKDLVALTQTVLLHEEMRRMEIGSEFVQRVF